MTMAEEKPATCCGQSGTRHVMWIHTRTPEQVRAVLAEDDLDCLPFLGWAARPEHANAPTLPERLTLQGAFCGKGLRVITDGANRRWPRARPTAVIVCAECGRGRCLGNPPRGWASGRHRWYQWFTDRGVNLKGHRSTSTVYDGMAVFTVAEVDPEALNAA